MNVLVVAAAALGLLGIGSRVYGNWIARKVGLDPDRPTPAQEVNDGRDYVPTRVPVLFAHHFSAIAGAGPILGPTIAMTYGFIPALVWIVFGAVFIGAVHDFTALFASLREGGKSIAEVARQTMGRAGFGLFCAFLMVMLVLVTGSFLSATATALTSQWPLEKLGLSPDQTLLKTHVTADGVVVGRIGGIASTSVIIITLAAPLMGWLIYRRGIGTLPAYLVAGAVCFLSVWAGLQWPITLDPKVWAVLLSVYVLFAAGAPVWVILQPRDFINTQILYAGMGLVAAALFSNGLKGMTMSFPAFSVAEGVQNVGALWPMMFVTIACGAISGFHSLVAGGTTSKQCRNEGDVKIIGFDAMVLESALGVLVIVTVGSALASADYQKIVIEQQNVPLGYALATGHLIGSAFGVIPVALGTVFGILMLEGFLVTSLDAAVRLNRYVFEELWGFLLKSPPAFLKHYWVNAGLSVLLMWVIASTNAWRSVWLVFGTANQLLAALTLLVVSAWLLRRGRPAWFAIVPSVFMMATTLVALAILLRKFLEEGKLVLVVADVLLFVLAAGMIVVAARSRVFRARGAAGA